MGPNRVTQTGTRTRIARYLSFLAARAEKGCWVAKSTAVATEYKAPSLYFLSEVAIAASQGSRKYSSVLFRAPDHAGRLRGQTLPQQKSFVGAAMKTLPTTARLPWEAFRQRQAAADHFAETVRKRPDTPKRQGFKSSSARMLLNAASPEKPFVRCVLSDVGGVALFGGVLGLYLCFIHFFGNRL